MYRSGGPECEMVDLRCLPVQPDSIAICVKEMDVWDGPDTIGCMWGFCSASTRQASLRQPNMCAWPDFGGAILQIHFADVEIQVSARVFRGFHFSDASKSAQTTGVPSGEPAMAVMQSNMCAVGVDRAFLIDDINGVLV